MKYLLLINKNEAAWRALSDAEREALAAKYAAYGRKMIDARIMRGGAIVRLKPVECFWLELAYHMQLAAAKPKQFYFTV